MAAYLSPAGILIQSFDNNGNVLSGGQIFTYIAGTTTPQVTYTDSTLGVSNSNPIVLDASGRLPAEIWVPANTPHKIIIKDASNNTLETIDNLNGINDPTSVLSELASASSGNGADLVANAVKSYSTFPAVRSAPVPSLVSGQTLVVQIEGSAAAGDGGGGRFWWNPTSTATDDGQTVIAPTAVSTGSGRYLVLPLTPGESTKRDFFVCAAGSATLTGPGPSFSGSFLGTALAGSKTIPANAFYPGKLMRLNAYGELYCVSTETVQQNIWLFLNQGTSTQSKEMSFYIQASGTGINQYYIDASIVCVSSSSGSVVLSVAFPLLTEYQGVNPNSQWNTGTFTLTQSMPTTLDLQGEYGGTATLTQQFTSVYSSLQGMF